MVEATRLKSDAEQRLLNNDLTGSEQLYRELLNVPDLKAEAYFGLAAVALKRGELEQSSTYLREVLLIQPRAFNAHLLLGNIAERKHDIAGARAYYQAVLSVNPDHVAALAGLKRISETTAEGAPRAKPATEQTAPESTPKAKLSNTAKRSSRTLFGSMFGGVLTVLGAVMPRPIVGKVSSFTTRWESSPIGNVYIWNFRLTDEAGATHAIEMRGVSFTGAIASGDTVEVTGTTAATLLTVWEARNVSSGSEVTAYYPYEARMRRPGWFRTMRFFWFLPRVVIAVVLLAAIAGALLYYHPAFRQLYPQSSGMQTSSTSGDNAKQPPDPQPSSSCPPGYRVWGPVGSNNHCVALHHDPGFGGAPIPTVTQ